MSNKFNYIIKTSEDTKTSIPKKQSINSRNDSKFRKIQSVSWNLSEDTDLTTDYITADVYEEDDELKYIYKEWDVEIISHESIADKLTVLLPAIHYNIIYKEPSENNINYSRSHEDLKNTYFFEIRDEKVLHLHVGFYIENAFDATESLKVPEVKLRISLRNALRINQ